MVGADMNGFQSAGAISVPAAGIASDTRERMKRVIAAIRLGDTPEQISAYLDGGAGFDDHVERHLLQPLVDEELSDHVDVLLSALQSPAIASL